MKKTTKGAIAAGAAALLLAGGAGTFAAWSDSGGDAEGATVQTGRLTVEQVAGSASWTWQTPGLAGQPFDPATDTLAPGDSVRFVADYALDIEGSNLQAQLVATSGTTGALPAGLTWTADPGNEIRNLTEDDDGTYTVGGTLAFDPTATGSMDQDIPVDDLTVTVTQTAPGTDA